MASTFTEAVRTIDKQRSAENEKIKPDFEKLVPKRSYLRRRKMHDIFMRSLVYAAALAALIPLASVLWTVASSGIKRLDGYFLTHNMKGVIGGLYPYGGILHAAAGTLEITLGAAVISVPIGIMAAIYLVEYSGGGKLHKAISFFVDVMSGIPSIVAGLFAFSLFAFLFGPGSVCGICGSVSLAILMLPTVVRSCEEMLKIVPNDLREASYALGVTKQRTITKVVLRTALPGIISGIMLAIARVVGETAPLLIAAGTIDSTNFNLFSGRMTTLPVYVYGEYSQGYATCSEQMMQGINACVPTIRSERAWAAALVLIFIVLLLNIAGRIIAKIFSVRKS